MICEITSSTLARNFLNSVPFDDYVPDGFPVCNPKSLVLGWYDGEWIAMFPCVLRRDAVEMHACIAKKARGKSAVEMGRRAIKWIFENTQYDLCVVYPKIRHGSAYAYQCGMRRNNGRFEVRKWADL